MPARDQTPQKACGEPPLELELEVQWQEQELGKYPTIRHDMGRRNTWRALLKKEWDSRKWKPKYVLCGAAVGNDVNCSTIGNEAAL